MEGREPRRERSFFLRKTDCCAPSRSASGGRGRGPRGGWGFGRQAGRRAAPLRGLSFSSHVRLGTRAGPPCLLSGRNKSASHGSRCAPARLAAPDPAVSAAGAVVTGKGLRGFLRSCVSVRCPGSHRERSLSGASLGHFPVALQEPKVTCLPPAGVSQCAGCCREANRPGRSCASVCPACAHVHSPPSPSRCTGPVATPASAPHPHAGQWSFLGGRRRLCRSPGRLSGRLHLGPPRRRDAGQSQGGGRWAGRPALRCFAALFSQYFPTRSTLFKVSVPVACAPVSASSVPSVRLYHSVPTHPVRSTPDLTGPQEAPPPPALSKAGPGVLSPGVVLRRSPPSTVSVRVPHGDHAVVPWRGAWYGADAQTCVRPN